MNENTKKIIWYGFVAILVVIAIIGDINMASAFSI